MGCEAAKGWRRKEQRGTKNRGLMKSSLEIKQETRTGLQRAAVGEDRDVSWNKLASPSEGTTRMHKHPQAVPFPHQLQRADPLPKANRPSSPLGYRLLLFGQQGLLIPSNACLCHTAAQLKSEWRCAGMVTVQYYVGLVLLHLFTFKTPRKLHLYKTSVI